MSSGSLIHAFTGSPPPSRTPPKDMSFTSLAYNRKGSGSRRDDDDDDDDDDEDAVPLPPR